MKEIKELAEVLKDSKVMICYEEKKQTGEMSRSISYHYISRILKLDLKGFVLSNASENVHRVIRDTMKKYSEKVDVRLLHGDYCPNSANILIGTLDDLKSYRRTDIGAVYICDASVDKESFIAINEKLAEKGKHNGCMKKKGMAVDFTGTYEKMLKAYIAEYPDCRLQDYIFSQNAAEKYYCACFRKCMSYFYGTDFEKKIRARTEYLKVSENEKEDFREDFEKLIVYFELLCPYDEMLDKYESRLSLLANTYIKETGNLNFSSVFEENILYRHKNRQLAFWKIMNDSHVTVKIVSKSKIQNENMNQIINDEIENVNAEMIFYSEADALFEKYRSKNWKKTLKTINQLKEEIRKLSEKYGISDSALVKELYEYAVARY